MPTLETKPDCNSIFTHCPNLSFFSLSLPPLPPVLLLLLIACIFFIFFCQDSSSFTGHKQVETVVEYITGKTSSAKCNGMDLMRYKSISDDGNTASRLRQL